MSNSIVKLSYLLKFYEVDSMKKLTLATLNALVLTLACSSVFAVDGTIRVNGVVTDQTCTLESRGGFITGLKDLTISLPAVSKSKFKPTNPAPAYFSMFLTNAEGTGDCDAATSKALQGVHLSAISPADLDADDKSLLVNKAIGAPTKNPVFIRLLTAYTAEIVDLTAPWGVQARSPVNYNRYIYYQIQYASKTGIVDPQNFTATINYTLHYN